MPQRAMISLTLTVALLMTADLAAQKTKKTPAGKADVLRSVPKRFAAFLGHQGEKVRLHLEGDREPSEWSLIPDAEIKVHGWWGRIEQLSKGQRVWAWFDIDRKKKPRAILMLADEITEHDIHNRLSSIEGVDVKRQSLTIKPFRGKQRELQLGNGIKVAIRDKVWEISQGKESIELNAGSKVYVQTQGEELTTILTKEGLEKAVSSQKDYLREQWRKEGLGGTVTFLHKLGGEMEIMLDHEAIRWGRYLKNGDAVTLKTEGDLKAVVKMVRPWRERTQVRLVSNTGLDQATLQIGQRLRVMVPEPPKEVQASILPTDVDRKRVGEERVEWILASTYCTCKVAGDRCTGMFYSLASCNVNACGMPNKIMGLVRPMIDQGMTDREILESLLKRRGPELLKPHLLP